MPTVIIMTVVYYVCCLLKCVDIRVCMHAELVVCPGLTMAAAGLPQAFDTISIITSQLQQQQLQQQQQQKPSLVDAQQLPVTAVSPWISRFLNLFLSWACVV